MSAVPPVPRSFLLADLLLCGLPSLGLDLDSTFESEEVADAMFCRIGCGAALGDSERLPERDSLDLTMI